MSKEKLLLVGSGGLGRVASEMATQEYECAFVDDGYTPGTVICGVSVVGHISDLPELYKEYQLLIVTIGNNVLRQRSYTFPNLIHSSAYISPYAKMGWGCVLLNNALIQNGSAVGNGVLLNPGVEIHHDSFVDDFALIYTNSVIRTLAKVGKRVRIGSNVTISNEVIVPDDEDIKNGVALY